MSNSNNMKCQKIECINDAWFVMSFKAANAERMSAATSQFPILQSQTIDLAATPFKTGEQVWPVVNAVLGKTIAAKDQVEFEMNEKTAVYKVTGTTLNFKIELVEIKDGSSISPDDFPPGIAVNRVPFKNWSGSIDVPLIWTCAPKNADEVVAVCNWAVAQNYQIRPRGIIHNWSPLSVAKDTTEQARIMLIDTTKYLNNLTMIPAAAGQPAQVQVQSGATMGDLMAFLEQQDNPKPGISGYGFSNIPAPDHLTVGGVLAINGHGTAVRTAPDDDFPCGYGSMSNHIKQLKAVVSDPDNPGQYKLKTFTRGEQECQVMLTQLGKTLVIEATLYVIDNYNLRCQSFTDVPASVLFAQPEGQAIPKQSLADYLQQTGRVEAIWFPFTDYPWLKVWQVAHDQPAGSRRVDGPNNYPFSDNLESSLSDLIKAIINGAPQLTPGFGKMMELATKQGLDGKNIVGIKSYPVSRDIWGPSKNSLFYVKDTTLRVTANGYAVMMKQSAVQSAVADFAEQFEQMLNSYQQKGQYPVNAPLEIRVTGLDSPDWVPAAISEHPGRPVISSLSTDQVSRQNGWDVAVWFDVLTLPGTTHANEFYRELEQWMLQRFTGQDARVMPEWSKGWAYTADQGPWTDAAFLDHIRKTLSTGRGGDDDWSYEQATLAKYDAKQLFTSPLLEQLFKQ